MKNYKPKYRLKKDLTLKEKIVGWIFGIYCLIVIGTGFVKTTVWAFQLLKKLF